MMIRASISWVYKKAPTIQKVWSFKVNCFNLRISVMVCQKSEDKWELFNVCYGLPWKLPLFFLGEKYGIRYRGSFKFSSWLLSKTCLCFLEEKKMPEQLYVIASLMAIHVTYNHINEIIFFPSFFLPYNRVANQHTYDKLLSYKSWHSVGHLYLLIMRHFDWLVKCLCASVVTMISRLIVQPSN